MATMTEKQPAVATIGNRKRRRTDAPAQGNEGKKRGRPKADKQDEDAADRRRTQIRMAQRAYRQRKESTLEELRSRVSELTQTIELMNKHFSGLNARLRSSGLSERQTAELSSFSVKVEDIVRHARDPTEETSAPVVAIDRSLSPALSTKDPNVEEVVARPQVKNVPSWLDQAAVSSVATRFAGWSLNEFGLGYTIHDPGVDDGGDDVLGPLLRQAGAQSVDPQANNPAETITFTNTFFDDDFAPFPLPPFQPSPPSTFNFQESTFARRLHRAALEKAYGLLLEPDILPATYERVFRLSLLGRSRAKILNILQIVLSRGPHEDLDFWEAPFIHIGGAGAHYPPRDAFDNVLPQRKSRNAGKIGPQTLALLDNLTREQIKFDMTVEIDGYEGEWFDPGDVQGYLEERGIFVDPAATFAGADMIMKAGQESTVASIASSVRDETPALTEDPPEVPHLDCMPWDNFIAGIDLASADFSGGHMSPLVSHSQQARSNSSRELNKGSTSRTRKIVIDVRKLIDALCMASVCLGRSPGFRRKDVDHALEIAIVNLSQY